MKLLSFLALGAIALCAVAFSPGPEIIFALILPVIVLVVGGHAARPWLKTFFSAFSGGVYHGYGHVHSRAEGLGAGGRHGPSHTIVALMLAVWALILATWRRSGHSVIMILKSISAGHTMAPTNTSAQPLPS